MELRQTEKELNELIESYNSLRCTTKLVSIEGKEWNDRTILDTLDTLRLLPKVRRLSTSWTTQEVAAPALDVPPEDSSSTTTTTTTSTNNKIEEEGEEDEAAAKSLTEVSSALQQLYNGLTAPLQPKIERYRKRLLEKDPVTGAPRYGATTFTRVNNLVTSYDALEKALSVLFGGEKWLQDKGTDSSCSPDIFRLLDTLLEQEEKEVQLAEIAAKAKEDQIQLALANQQQRDEEQKQNEMEASRLQRLQEEAELAERARQIRQARLDAMEAERRAQEDAERADQQWVASIQKGPAGVREQLQILRNATTSSSSKDESAFTTALNALHTLFTQITAHPEESNFRRIRRDHPKFQQDIGRHDGGKEILIAAGFVLGAIDGVPCFISKEPDIEKDMDGWAQWFDLLKATLAIIEEEMIK